MQTPIDFALPVARTFSMFFQPSTWFQSFMMSREPSGSLGNLSSFPRRRKRYQSADEDLRDGGRGGPTASQCEKGNRRERERYIPFGFINSGQC